MNLFLKGSLVVLSLGGTFGRLFIPRHGFASPLFFFPVLLSIRKAFIGVAAQVPCACSKIPHTIRNDLHVSSDEMI